MLPELRFERDLTAYDRAFLAAMDRAMRPQGVVRVEQCCAAIDANDYITRQNFTLRHHRTKLLKRLRAERTYVNAWRHAALVCAGIVVVLIVVLGVGVSG